METVEIKLIHYDVSKKTDVYSLISRTDDWEKDRLMYIKLIQELGEKLSEKRKEENKS